MAGPEKASLEIQSGVVKTDAPYSVQGRWIDCDKVYFKKGRPEKQPGYISFLLTEIIGIVRRMLAWDDNDDHRWLGIGTHLKLFVVDIEDSSVTDITPLRSSGSLLTDPFAVVNLSTTVTVTHAAHGLTAGDYVHFAGATIGGGITINGEYTVEEVLTANTYTIIHSAAATSTDATTGGAAVLYEYEISPGTTNAVSGAGWGVGGWGTGTWGTPREGLITFTRYPRIWSLAKYGENLLAQPSGGKAAQWDPDAPTVRAVTISTAPDGNFMFVTNERAMVILGAGDELMALAVSKSTDITDFTYSTPSVPSTSFLRTLQEGSRLVAGTNLINTLNLIWSDTAVYRMQYTGAINIVYETVLAGRECGLIGPHAFAVDGAGYAYWMSGLAFFRYTGSVSQIPNAEDVHNWLYARLDPKQNWKCHAEFLAQHNYVIWYYVKAGDEEPAYQVGVNLDDMTWIVGTYDRTAKAMQSGINSRSYGASVDGTIWQHEVGVDADTEAMEAYVQSAPVDVADGNQMLDIFGYVPNFFTQTGNITLLIEGHDYPEETTPIDEAEEEIEPGDGMIDLRMSGRQVSLRLTSNVVGGNFRLGRHRVETKDTGRRR